MESLDSYKNQLLQVEGALAVYEEGPDKGDLLTLRDDLKYLIKLTEDSLKSNNEEDEYTLFMAEMAKEGAVSAGNESVELSVELQALEGMKCRAPHTHKWGDTMYHNAIVCSVIPPDKQQSSNEIQVKVMFINPTQQEMLPCPYLMESNCKFSDELCKYSHGEVVIFSSLQEYFEPNFETVKTGSPVLAKQNNKLWGRAVVKQLFGIKCRVKFDSNQLEADLELQDVLPLNGEDECNEVNVDSESDTEQDDIINMSLMNTPSSQALGDWEKHTKGFGSKIMQKMGYIVGTGLGRDSTGRIEPVSAVILPPGKSLDHCMHLRENAGGDKDLFSVEKKLKRLQKRREIQNQKAYEREKNKVDVFNFMNDKLLNAKDTPNLSLSKNKHRQDVKKETSRNLNVAGLKIDEDIKRMQLEVVKISESLKRHSDVHSHVYKSLKQKLLRKESELQSLKDKALNISHEQSIRNNKKKLTVF